MEDKAVSEVANDFFIWGIDDAPYGPVELAVVTEWIKDARAKPFLTAGGEKLREMLPDDIDSLVAKIKAKKGAPTNEEPPADVEPDKIQPAPTDASSEAPTEAPAEAAPQSDDKPE